MDKKNMITLNWGIIKKALALTYMEEEHQKEEKVRKQERI